MLPLVFLVLAISVGAVDFKYRDYAEITTFFQKLQQDHGDIVEVFDALQKWPDIAPDKTDLPRCGNSPCEWLVVHITNLTSYKQNPLKMGKYPRLWVRGVGKEANYSLRIVLNRMGGGPPEKRRWRLRQDILL
eukprot:GEMP01114750.1.p1 GENE.GEMP01114750.1~~GEMP01114750.1.p1  ORF type:complete len:154 (+),score=9.59 GEMP01114750.1:65-463(+)